MAKSKTAAERLHMNKVAALGCICCRILGHPDTPCELHHPRSGAGIGRKSSNMDVLPLCAAHHRGTMHPQVPSIHLAKRAFIEEFGTEEQLLEMVRGLI